MNTKFRLNIKQIIAIVLVVIAAVLCGRVVIAMIPSNTVEPLSKYYGITGNEARLIIDLVKSDGGAFVDDGNGYIDADTAAGLVPRLHPDTGDDLVVYTTATEKYIFTPDELTYTVNGEEKKADVLPVIKGDGGRRYISTGLMKELYDMDINVSSNPGRIVIFSKEQEVDAFSAKSDVAVRVEADIKSNILERVKKGTRVYDLGDGGAKGFERVFTEDGVTGYAKLSELGEVSKVKFSFDRKNDATEYTSITKKNKVIMVWHQVTNTAANANVADMVGPSNANVISPTWFAVSAQNADLSYLADKEYVKTVHDMGLEVWPTVTDFDKNIDFAAIYGAESSRSALIGNIMYFIKEYDLDGINIDFEKVTAGDADDFTQFIRELSVEMRKSGKVLSVDTYIPTEYTAYYDRKEIATVADYLVIMAYDEHYAGSPEAGSVSTVSWVRKGITNSLELMDQKKLIVGLPFYTRLWRVNGDTVVSSKALSMDGGLNAVAAAGKKPQWSEKSGQFVAKWKDGDDTMKIWLEDERSIAAKLDVVKKEAPDCAGVSFWKLGLQRDAVWPEVGTLLK